MRPKIFVSLLLIASTVAVFAQVRNYDFVYYDDPGYINDNSHVKMGLTRASFIWAFTTTHMGNWHPLTWLSHMLDCQLYGLNPSGHHLTSVLLHVANAVLLFLLLNRMTGGLWRSACVAALFALHPLHVESVAWVSERKDVLSTLFWILTMWAYVRYVERPGLARYILALLTFALGLMAKPMLVTLPFVLILLDYWPLERFRPSQLVADAPETTRASKEQGSPFLRLLWEKIPFFSLSAISSVVTFLIQRSGGAMTALDVYPVKIRLANGLVSYVSYIGKMIWPHHLAVLYPAHAHFLPIWQATLAGLALVAITTLVIWGARLHHRYLAMGWFWYLGTLMPVIGLVQVGQQAMADRYTYVPLIGLFVMIAWGVRSLFKNLRHRRVVLGTAAGALLLCLATRSWLQLGHWENSLKLFEHAITVTDNNYVMHNNLGLVLGQQGRTEEAIAHYSEALRIKPEDAESHNNLGILLAEQGKLEQAMTHYLKVLQLEPDNVEAHNNVGVALDIQGRFEEAIFHFSEALRIDPEYVKTYNNLGVALAARGRLQEAIPYFSEALRLEPVNAEAHNNLGLALARQRMFEEAISHYDKALSLNPEYAEAHNNLGVALAAQGRFREAIAHFSEALRIRPDYAEAQKNLQLFLPLTGRSSGE